MNGGAERGPLPWQAGGCVCSLGKAGCPGDGSGSGTLPTRAVPVGGAEGFRVSEGEFSPHRQQLALQNETRQMSEVEYPEFVLGRESSVWKRSVLVCLKVVMNPICRKRGLDHWPQQA